MDLHLKFEMSDKHIQYMYTVSNEFKFGFTLSENVDSVVAQRWKSFHASQLHGGEREKAFNNTESWIQYPPLRLLRRKKKKNMILIHYNN